MNKRVGRHLVELLVVAVAIAGIAVVIIMVDMRAAGRARELQCASNVHQLAVAMQQYADDHDGRLALGPDWQTQLLSYSERPEDPKLTMLSCPARPNQPGFATGLNYDVAARRADAVAHQVWLIEVRNGSGEVWWANDIRFHRLSHNRFPVAPHRNRASISRGDGSVRTRDPLALTVEDWIPPVTEQTAY